MPRRAKGLLRAAVLAWVSVAGCSDAEVVLQRDPFSLGEGRFLLQVSERAVGLERDGQRLISLDPGSFQLGVVDDLGSDRSWDPWEIEQHGNPAVTFLAPIAWSPVLEPEGQGISVDLDYGGGVAARLEIGVASSSRFTFTLSPLAPQPGQRVVVLARVRVRTSGDPGEGFYGMGGQLDTVDNRGKLRPMQLEVEEASETKTNDAHAPVPLLIGTRGWGMFAATYRVGVFDVARKDPSVVEATFAVAPRSAGERADAFRVDLFVDDTPLDLYREYYAASGLVRPPPPWSLGPWLWRNSTKGQTEVEADIAAVRDLDLATSGIWINPPFEHAVNTFDFDPARFADPEAMLAHAHVAGLRLALWSVPYLEPSAEPMWSEATASGFFPLEKGKTFNTWGPPLDFTSPAASAFWRGLVRRYTSIGVDGFKLDFGEDIVPSLGGVRNAWSFSDGSDERTMHHRFSNLYHRAYSDAATGREPDLPVKDNPPPFMLVRGAHWGEQSLGVILWPGDMDATFTHHGEPARSGAVVAGIGGLPASVVMGLSLAASGFSFSVSDTGGYQNSPADKELFVRWAEHAALSTVMEVGDATNDLPWAGRDAETLDILKTYARLHVRLFPYEWSYAQRMLVDGRPLQRPLGLAHPELGRHPDDEYLFGDDLLVAPVVARGQTRRRLVVPSGTWLDFWDGTPLAGDVHGEIEVDAPLGKLPLFVREGAIVPMLRPTIDTLSMAADPRVESFERDPGALWALVAPGPPAAFDLWDGSRVARTAPGVYDVRDGTVFKSGFVLQIIATDQPALVLSDAQPLTRISSAAVLDSLESGWTWTSERGGTLLVKVPPNQGGNATRVVVQP
jgi:alpha-D-xyloside xylohydrolase